MVICTQDLLLSVTVYGMGYPFGQLGSAVLAVLPPNQHLQPVCCRVGNRETGGNRGFDAIQALFSSS